MAIGLDVASTYFTPIWTRFLIAPLSLSFHRASPRLGRCAKHNSKTGFPGLEAQHLKNTARYINHSCDPNCALQTTSRTIWVVALRDIQAGEELTHQYNYEYDPDRYTEFPCFCGAKNCIGYIVDARYWEVITQHQYDLTG